MNLFFKKIKKKSIVAIIFTSMIFLSQMAKAQFTINDEYANLIDCDTMSKGIFIIWWDNEFNFSEEANVMLDSMLSYRDYCLNNLGMQDPLGSLDGYFCNIYIHNEDNPTDFFSTNYPEWGNGVGGDDNGYAYMTLPSFILGNWINLAHETFHIFQTHGMWDITPGVYNTDDGGWFVEASANWFAYNRYSNLENSFIESEILVRIPHVPLWLAWENFPDYYPNNWQREVHQYGLSTYLYYLTKNAGISESDLVSIFYSGTSLSPQEYLYTQIGGEIFRNHFIDCAAHMTNNFDFIQPNQLDEAQDEWSWAADPIDDNKFIQTYTNTGSDGWFQPDDALTTNAWSFNTYKLLNTNTETYTFEINGDMNGNYGDASYFKGKVLVQNSDLGAIFHDLVMDNDYQGSLSLGLTPNDTAVYFIISSMPEIFEDDNAAFQLFPYKMKISAASTTGIGERRFLSSKYEIARFNTVGQKIDENNIGLQIILYNDGSTKRSLKQN